MGKYENGAYTRQTILDACKQLFYEKGFHETSYADICKLAHVNRGTIYYHFPSKENMRYEVMWEYMLANRQVAAKYCSDAGFQFYLALIIMWKQNQKDENLRKFWLQCCLDYPVYTGKKDLTYFYYTLYEKIWQQSWEQSEISELAFASAYGYIMSCMRMACEHPEKYEPMDIFTHCVQSSAYIWGIPKDIMEEILSTTEYYISLIPEGEIGVNLT